jgi:GTP cyclohydrolase I
MPKKTSPNPSRRASDAPIDDLLIQEGVALILEGIGADLNDRNFKDTPARVARMYRELFTPRENTYATFPERHNSLILLRGHTVHGVCPHHLVPVEMRVYVGYIPRREVLGLSKLARVAEEPLTGPIMQETYTDLVADKLLARTKAKGVGVVVAGRHGCMQHRGVKTEGDVVTSAMRGVFLKNHPAREELLRLIGRV